MLITLLGGRLSFLNELIAIQSHEEISYFFLFWHFDSDIKQNRKRMSQSSQKALFSREE